MELVVKRIGACLPLFLVAVALDVIGIILLFIGIFANLRLNGSFYGDFLIYTGSLVIFLSLFLWLGWYVGNVPVSEFEIVKKRGSIARLARKFSERLSQKLRGDESVKHLDGVKQVDLDDVSVVGSRPYKASRVTWGRSTTYNNEGYEDSVDSTTEQKEEEMEKEEKEEF